MPDSKRYGPKGWPQVVFWGAREGCKGKSALKAETQPSKVTLLERKVEKVAYPLFSGSLNLKKHLPNLGSAIVMEKHVFLGPFWTFQGPFEGFTAVWGHKVEFGVQSSKFWNRSSTSQTRSGSSFSKIQSCFHAVYAEM